METKYTTLNKQFSDNLEKFSKGKVGLIFLSFWSFIEPSFWFIAADMPLIIMSIYSSKRFKKLLLYTLIFAIIGVILYFILNLIAYDAMNSILLATPFVPSDAFDRIKDIYNEHGYFGLLYQSFSFISVKIWINIAVEYNYSLFIFVILTGISRTIRFFIVALIGGILGKYFINFFRKHSIIFFILYISGFIMMLLQME